MNGRLKTLLTAALTVAIVCVLVGCNTMEGLGKDIKKGGEKLEDAAASARD